MSTTFDDKIEELKKQVDSLSSSKKGPSFSCGTTSLIVGGIVPFVVVGLFYIIKPKFLMKQETTPPTVNTKKLVQWALVITVMLWIALYIYSFYGDSLSSLMCIVSKKQ
jgi:heme/copper-type cytochrome/quinol oxidase subunit 2